MRSLTTHQHRLKLLKVASCEKWEYMKILRKIRNVRQKNEIPYEVKSWIQRKAEKMIFFQKIIIFEFTLKIKY